MALVGCCYKSITIIIEENKHTLYEIGATWSISIMDKSILPGGTQTDDLFKRGHWSSGMEFCTGLFSGRTTSFEGRKEIYPHMASAAVNESCHTIECNDDWQLQDSRTRIGIQIPCHVKVEYLTGQSSIFSATSSPFDIFINDNL